MKRISLLSTTVPFAALTAALVIIGMSFASRASAFVDVSESHPNADAIMYMEDFSVVDGYPDDTFKPDQTINRAEFTKIIVEARYDSEEIDDILSRVRLAAMADVQGGSWYERYVNAARAFDMVHGYPDGLFRPNRAINFAETSKMIAEAYALRDTQGSVWYESYVRALGDVHAIPTSIGGFDDGISRGEIAEIIYRLETGNTSLPSLTYEQLAANLQQGKYVGPGCKLGGCGSQVCQNIEDEDAITTCEWREEYACYQTARCEKQNNGDCGWTQTEELTSCLADHGVPTNACAAMLCPVNTYCEDGMCIPLDFDETTSSSSVQSDNCNGVICPVNTRCDLGQCVHYNAGASS